MFQIKHYETLETFNNEKSNLETPWVAYVEENSTVYYSVDDITKYRAFLVRQKDISNITYEAVDLGLPSGLKWADRNVGASSPEDFGSYFQWGDTNAYTYDGVGEIPADELAHLFQSIVGDEMEVTKDNVGMILEQMLGITGTDLTNNSPWGRLEFSLDKLFDFDSYFDTTDGGSTFNKYNTTGGGVTILESIDDAATVHMGNTWRIPTAYEITELMENTIQIFIDLDGNEYSKEQTENGVIKLGKLKGVRFTGSNGNSIFIPAAGMGSSFLFSEFGMQGIIWSSNSYDSIGDGLSFDSQGIISGFGGDRCYGCSVRGVLKQ